MQHKREGERVADLEHEKGHEVEMGHAMGHETKL